MIKVHITLKTKKGDTLISACGLLDKEAKEILVPKQSKKGNLYIDTVRYDSISNTERGWRCDQVVYLEDKCFVNSYYLADLAKLDGKEVK